MSLRTCSGASCKRKTDCLRFIERTAHPMGERFPAAPWRIVKITQADGTQKPKQVCEHQVERVAA